MVDSSSVLIVGAGPVGLTLANALAAYGVPFRIIDSKPCTTNQSKGLAVNISSLYGLELLGLHGQIGKSGVEIEKFNVHWNNKIFTRIDFGSLDFSTRSLITQPQWKTESELESALLNKDIDVFWSHRLTKLTKREDGSLEAEITNDESVVKANFDYVVGCDGKRSVVREHLGATLTGRDYDFYMSLGDFYLDLDISQTDVHYYVYDDTLFILVPISSDGLWRVVTSHQGNIPNHEFDKKATEKILARLFGDSFKLNESQWTSKAQLYLRTSDKLQKENVFIAGDAAHLFSPIGGTGMNTGIQDALNLAWKLALVFHDVSETSLLDAYEAERIPAIEQAAAIADLSTQLITREKKEHPLLESMALTLSNRKFIKKELPVMHSGLGTTIKPAGISNAQSERAPVGKISKLFAQIYRENLTLSKQPWKNCIAILINTHHCSSEISNDLYQILSELHQWPFVEIIYYRFEAPTSSKRTTTYCHDKIIVHSELGIDEPERQYTLQVVRPDGFCQSVWMLDEAWAMRDSLVNDFHLSSKYNFTEIPLETMTVA
ncbi:MAG: FAD-dependent monooxygenase [Cellvibrionales bacterium]|nr:FAD-dependent monooxygenase [Cellvibrionales bacterium]